MLIIKNGLSDSGAKGQRGEVLGTEDRGSHDFDTRGAHVINVCTEG